MGPERIGYRKADKDVKNRHRGLWSKQPLLL